MYKVVIAPDARLRVKTRIVKKFGTALQDIIKEMVKTTLSFKDPEGVGLASTQIGNDERYFVGMIGNEEGEDKIKLKAFINPQIIWMSKRTKKYFEGCLSIPDYWGETIRSIQIKVIFQDLSGHTHSETLKGVDAWIFQHEVDHLESHLFVDRVLEQKGRFFKFIGKDKRGQDQFERVEI